MKASADNLLVEGYYLYDTTIWEIMKCIKGQWCMKLVPSYSKCSFYAVSKRYAIDSDCPGDKTDGQEMEKSKLFVSGEMTVKSLMLFSIFSRSK
jgi:hypothetical protein